MAEPPSGLRNSWRCRLLLRFSAAQSRAFRASCGRYLEPMASGAGFVDHFPSTHRTWIEAQLTVIAEAADGDAHTSAATAAAATEAHRALCAFIMARYHEPLCAYVTTAALRDLGEPHDLVAGFFAKSLATPAMFNRWLRTGISLRRWLMNAIALHCRSLRRDKVRSASRLRSDQEMAPLSAPGPSAEREFDRVWALTIANEAHAHARTEVLARGRADDYEAFRLHIFEGCEHAEIARRLGITRTQSVNAVRRLSQVMRDQVRVLLRAEGIDGSDLDAAVAEVISLSAEPPR